MDCRLVKLHDCARFVAGVCQTKKLTAEITTLDSWYCRMLEVIVCPSKQSREEGQWTVSVSHAYSNSKALTAKK